MDEVWFKICSVKTNGCYLVVAPIQRKNFCELRPSRVPGLRTLMLDEILPIGSIHLNSFQSFEYSTFWKNTFPIFQIFEFSNFTITTLRKTIFWCLIFLGKTVHYAILIHNRNWLVPFPKRYLVFDCNYSKIGNWKTALRKFGKQRFEKLEEDKWMKP